MVGTLVNTGAIIIGSVTGILIRSRLPQKVIDIVFQGIGLFTIVIGISMSLRSDSMLLIVISIVSGAVIGQLLDIDKHIRRFTDFLQTKAQRKKPGEVQSGDAAKKQQMFTEGFITASMIFCIGSMSILGAIEDGMGETPNLLYTNSIMDGTVAIVPASSLGLAVMLHSLAVLLFQGCITLLATLMVQFMSDTMIADLTAVGGVLLIGLGINILKIKDINLINMLPSLLVIILLSYFF